MYLEENFEIIHGRHAVHSLTLHSAKTRANKSYAWDLKEREDLSK